MANFDPEVLKAIAEAVKEQRQPETVANRLEAWLNAMSVSDLKDKDNKAHFDNILDVITINGKGDNDEN